MCGKWNNLPRRNPPEAHQVRPDSLKREHRRRVRGAVGAREREIRGMRWVRAPEEYLPLPDFVSGPGSRLYAHLWMGKLRLREVRGCFKDTQPLTSSPMSGTPSN